MGQKNQDASSFEMSEISLAKLILEQFTVNKETYKILLDIIYGDEGKGNGISTINQEINKQIKAYNEILKQHNNYLMSLYNISRGL